MNHLKKENLSSQLFFRKNYNPKNIGFDLKTIERSISNKLIQFNELIKLKTKQIHQSNPKIILKKGYAIIRDDKYKIVKN